MYQLHIDIEVQWKGNIMKIKFISIISIILLVIAIFIIWDDNTHVIGIVLLIISGILNLIRDAINLWNNRKLK